MLCLPLTAIALCEYMFYIVTCQPGPVPQGMSACTAAIVYKLHRSKDSRRAEILQLQSATMPWSSSKHRHIDCSPTMFTAEFYFYFFWHVV